jgi:transcriptional regulator with AAA-type ATPase domain
VLDLEREGKHADALRLSEGADPSQVGDGSDLFELSLVRARLLYYASRYRAALQVIDHSVAEAPGPIARQLEVLRAAVLSAIEPQDEPQRLLQAAAANARAAGDRLAEAEATAWLVLVSFRSADLVAAEEAGRKALALLANEPCQALARAHRHLAVVFGVQRRYTEALEQHRCAIGIYRALGDPLGIGREYLSLALHYLDMGESELAELYMRKGLGIAESCDDDPLRSLALSRLGTLSLARGQPEQALRHYQSDLEIARRTESPRAIAFALRNVGRALDALGRVEEALASLEESAGIFESVGDRVNHGLALLDEAVARSSVPGPAAAAFETAQRGRSLLEGTRRSHLSPLADLAEAHARLARGEVDEAVACFDRAVDTWASEENVARAAQAGLRFGAALAKAGRHEQAQAALQRSLDLTVRGNQPELTSALLARIDELNPHEVVLRPLRAAEPVSGETAPPASADEIVGTSSGIIELRRLLAKVAPTRVPVLITGESGVGKELVARALHGSSPRSGRPLAIINCGAIPSELVESELFGHVRGAFTGALRDSPGRLAAADGGTVFLDEIGELPLPAQVKLLRFLQSGEVHTVGESAPRPRRLDVRVVAATHRDLAAMVAQGTFRHDLYFRLNVFPLHVPPLRERKSDLPALVEHVMATDPTLAELGIRAVSPEAIRALAAHDWPGNVRELQSALVRAAVVAVGDTILSQDLPDFGASGPDGSAPFPTLVC